MENLLGMLGDTPYEAEPGRVIRATVSAGMSVFTGAKSSTDQLLARASDALQKAEQKGPGRFRQAL